jgi:hypothetical protein
MNVAALKNATTSAFWLYVSLIYLSKSFIVIKSNRLEKLILIYNNGDDGDRTHNLRLAKPALSQLSYVPKISKRGKMGPGRLELPTSRLSGVRSSQLSYEPNSIARLR